MAHTGRNGATFGVTMSGRSLDMDDIDRVMGLCINNLPLMVWRDPAQSTGDWLRQLLDANLELRQREHASLPQIQRWVGCDGQALYDSLVIFENYPVDAAVSNGAGAALQLDDIASHGALGMPLTLIIVPTAQTLTFSLDYARDVFSATFIENLMQKLTQILKELPDSNGEGTPWIPAFAGMTESAAGTTAGAGEGTFHA
jgi:non-ribosomal peptide synthetase component F